jgi:DHA1 family bicyclomycin/chloramphenicol resistance-like MFS transporter
MALVTMIFGLAPAVAPVIGGWLLRSYSWHAIFVFLACYAACLFAVCWFRLPETHPPAARHPFALVPLASRYLQLGRSGRLLLLSLATGLNWAGGFLYVAAAPRSSTNFWD